MRIAWRIDGMTIRIVIGTALSGKTNFIKEKFSRQFLN